MTAKGKFVNSAMPNNPLRNMAELRQRLAGVEVRLGIDADVSDADQIVNMGNDGAVLTRGIADQTEYQSIKWKDSDDLTASLRNESDTFDTIQTNIVRIAARGDHSADGRHVIYLNAGYPSSLPVVNITLDTGDGGTGSPAHPQAVIQMNANQVDVDTEVYGTATVPLIKVDAATDRVGIGTASPGYKFDVAGVSNASAFHSQTVSLNDDTAYSFTPPTDYGVIFVYTLAANEYGHVGYGTAGPATLDYGIGSSVAITTGALTNGTANGTDGKLNISAHTDGKLYIKNRLGGARGVTWVLFSHG